MKERALLGTTLKVQGVRRIVPPTEQERTWCYTGIGMAAEDHDPDEELSGEGTHSINALNAIHLLDYSAYTTHAGAQARTSTYRTNPEGQIALSA